MAAMYVEAMEGKSQNRSENGMDFVNAGTAQDLPSYAVTRKV